MTSALHTFALVLLATNTAEQVRPSPGLRQAGFDVRAPSWDVDAQLTSCPDVDGDGKREIVVGVKDSRQGAGRVAIVSTRDGRVLLERAHDTTKDGITSALAPEANAHRVDGALSSCMAPLGFDFDRDGRDDRVTVTRDTHARLAVISGRDEATLLAKTHALADTFLGCSLAAGRDVNGDGVNDLVVGWPNDGGTSNAYVFCGADLQLLRTLPEVHPGGYYEGFGASVALLRDLNRDGCAEIAVGCAEAIDSGDEYYAAVFDGRTGQPLGSTSTNHRYVRVAALDDDLDGDGCDELLLGSSERGEVTIVSGASVATDPESGGWRVLRVVAASGAKDVSESALLPRSKK